MLLFIIAVIFTLVSFVVVTVIDYRRQYRRNIANQEKIRAWLGTSDNIAAEIDADGYRKDYDAHYTRQLEKEQGVKVTTQCDDTSCTECYWKARMLKSTDARDFGVSGRGELFDQRKKWINEQLDGLSDELYDSLYEDWLEDNKEAIERQRKTFDDLLEYNRRLKEEAYYATPYNLIELYKKEGRTYTPGNGWSRPNARAMEVTVLPASDMKINTEPVIRTEDVWQLRKERKLHKDWQKRVDEALIAENPILKVTTDYQYSVKAGIFWRIQTGHHLNGGKSISREEITREEYRRATHGHK